MKKYRTILVMTYLFLAVAGFGLENFYHKTPQVTLSRLSYGDIQDTVSYSGVVSAESYGVFTAKPAKVEKIYVEVGQYVKEGDLLAKVDVNDISVNVMNNFPSLPEISVSESDLARFYSSGSLDTLIDSLSSLTASDYITVSAVGAALRAPISGYVMQINAVQGGYSSLVTPMFVITDLNDMSLRVSVGEDKINKIQVGQSVSVTGTGFAGEYQGQVESIATSARQAIFGSGSTIDVKIAITGASRALMPGFSATAKIRIGTREEVPIIPLEDILQDDRGQEFIYIYDDGMIRRRDITCKYSSTGVAEVSGVEPHDLIVCAPAQELEDGQYVLLDEEWRQW